MEKSTSGREWQLLLHISRCLRCQSHENVNADGLYIGVQKYHDRLTSSVWAWSRAATRVGSLRFEFKHLRSVVLSHIVLGSYEGMGLAGRRCAV